MKADPIRSKTKQQYLASIQHQFKRASDRRTIDPETPVTATILQVAQDLADRTDISEETRRSY